VLGARKTALESPTSGGSSSSNVLKNQWFYCYFLMTSIECLERPHTKMTLAQRPDREQTKFAAEEETSLKVAQMTSAGVLPQGSANDVSGRNSYSSTFGKFEVFS
jgi:hypothetical protein